MVRFLVVMICCGVPAICCGEDLFSDRILPLANAPEGSSCADCHLSGVELRNYVGQDEVSTFSALRAAGLINVDEPEKSKLLAFIDRRPEHSRNELTERVRVQERKAFGEWITQAVRNPALLKATENAKPLSLLPPEVIRHARTDHVTSRFVDAIWSEIGRCQNCHAPDRNRHQIGRMTKDEVDAISWIVPNDPAATLQKLVDAGNVDLEHPENSPLLTKPAALTDHGGGPKFFPGSDTYRKFVGFLRDYAAVRKGTYQSVASLPEAANETILLTEQQLRITEIPEEFAGMGLQVNIFAWDQSAGTWSARRVATAFSRVNEKGGIWQNQVLLVRLLPSPPSDSDKPLLPAGRYRLEILIDSSWQTKKNAEYQLTEGDRKGLLEISGDWPPGYQPPRIVQFPMD